MTEDADLVGQVATDILERTCGPEVVAAAEGGWSPEVWSALEASDLTRVGVPEERGGPGGGWPEAAAVLRACGRHAAPVPIAETSVLAGWLLADAGLDVPRGPLGLARGEGLEITGGELRGLAPRVAWARQAKVIVAIAKVRGGLGVAVVDPAACRITPGQNLAREPRDGVLFDGVPVAVTRVADGAAERLVRRGALARAIQMTGALDRILELTVSHVRSREQFGRPLVQFQAVQQEIARLAGEVAGAGAAVEAAIAAPDDEAAVASAKTRTGLAAAEATRIAHQLHGAIGVTQEHRLHHFTSRLWSWRDEYGGERTWAARLGRIVAAMGPDEYWAWLTR